MFEGAIAVTRGRKVLLKVVALAILTYSMSCFLLPGGLLVDLEILMTRFLSGQKNSKRKIHWVEWKKLCKPKAHEELGFRDLKSFNFALLAKKRWKIMQDTSTLLHKLCKASYFSNNNFNESKLGHNSSYVWRGIMAAKPWLLRGCR